MKLAICSFVLLLALPATAVVSAQTSTIDFNNDKVGEAPSGGPVDGSASSQTRDGRRRCHSVACS